jgi:hypothetical protein
MAGVVEVEEGEGCEREITRHIAKLNLCDIQNKFITKLVYERKTKHEAYFYYVVNCSIIL